MHAGWQLLAGWSLIMPQPMTVTLTSASSHPSQWQSHWLVLPPTSVNGSYVWWRPLTCKLNRMQPKQLQRQFVALKQNQYPHSSHSYSHFLYYEFIILLITSIVWIILEGMVYTHTHKHACVCQCVYTMLSKMICTLGKDEQRKLYEIVKAGDVLYHMGMGKL